jgi:hypothetical protein
MDDREELEHVPWQELLVAAQPEDRQRRTVYVGAGLVAALVVGVALSRMVWAPAPAPSPLPPTDITSPEAASTGEEPVLPDLTGLPMYSEADLMASPPDPAERAAIARAEWFVADYFTADLDPSGSADVRAALPEGVLAGFPQDLTEGISYVEWARAFRVAAVGDGSYRVGVLFRTLSAPPDRGFVRQPVRAVEVLVAVRADGGSAVLDLPAPLPMPAGPEPVDLPAPADPPPGVVEAAVADASAWGTEPRFVSAHALGGGWRVVVTVADSAGKRWPLAVRVGGG